MYKNLAFKGSILLIISIFLLFLSVFVVTAQVQLSQTDAVYLLDVTASMVGREAGSTDILDEVLDILLFDIEHFRGGRFILITFADGPCDLDGQGPIQAIYQREIQTEQDKLYLKQFLKPKKYGSFQDDPQWEGVYEAVQNSQRCRGPTGIYKTILEGLKILEQLQGDTIHSEKYALSHVQELFAYTDGRNNAPLSPSFEEVVDKLIQRHFQMLGRFRYTRYLFTSKREDTDQAKEECRIFEKKGAIGVVKPFVVPDITKFVIIDFDRSILGFPNIWAPTPPEDSRTVMLRNIQLYYDQTKANLLEGGQLVIQPVKAKDFGLPGDIAVKVRTEPTELRFPLKQFDLQITLEPFSRLKAFMQQEGKDGLKGFLRFEFVTDTQSPQKEICEIPTQKEPVIDLKQSPIVIDLPYVRPALQAEWSVERGEAFALTLVPNEVFQALRAEEQQVRVYYNERYLTLTDDQGQAHKSSEPFSLQGVRKLVCA